MTCIKTGAIVRLTINDLCFLADLFKVGTAIVIRSNGPIVRGKNALPLNDERMRGREPTHLVSSGYEEFWREELGVLVVEAQHCKEVA